MATTKTYTVAGTSTNNGETKVRFAQDYVGRFKILNKNGHTDIELLELDTAMSKSDICKMLLGHDKFQSEAQQSAITQFVVRNVSADTTPTPAPTPPAVEPVVEVELETESA
jgi:hypothetical protein|tara:strand:- start:152 stop:487 length:336 start_codon:yes stop_codon:yes gene_type:complete